MKTKYRYTFYTTGGSEATISVERYERLDLGSITKFEWSRLESDKGDILINISQIVAVKEEIIKED